MSNSVCDENFLNIGNKDGIIIWRIEDFKLTSLNPSEYGSFYVGDSYLLLYTKSLPNSRFEWNIHFWLGIDTTLDEMATAAIKAVELDDHLGGTPVQYREVQLHESKLFLSYFENVGGIRYLMGGIKSGFRSMSDRKESKKLYMVKGKRDVRIIEVPFHGSSLNRSDVFILKDGDDIYQWNPPKTSRIEKMKANTFAKKIKDEENGGSGNIHIIEDDWDTNETFWNMLNCKVESVKENSDVDDQEFEVKFNTSNFKLYRVNDARSNKPTIKHIADGPLKKTLLESSDCFIIDGKNYGIYSWIGKRCSKNEKLACIQGAKEIMTKNNYPNYYPMIQCIDGAETITFKAIFSDW